MTTTYRQRLAATIDQMRAGADTSEQARAIAILTDLLDAQLPPGRIIAALDGQIAAADSAGVVTLLGWAREDIIGEPITAARAANDAINARIVDDEHRGVA